MALEKSEGCSKVISSSRNHEINIYYITSHLPSPTGIFDILFFYIGVPKWKYKKDTAARGNLECNKFVLFITVTTAHLHLFVKVPVFYELIHFY